MWKIKIIVIGFCMFTLYFFIGYDGFPDFFPSLMELIKNKLLSHMQCNELGLSTK